MVGEPKLNIYLSNNNVIFDNIKYPIIDFKEIVINNIKHTIYKTKEETLFYFVDNNLHRENDLPAIEWQDGSRIWAVNHQIHRNTQNPAIIWAFGKVEYYWKNIPTTKEKIDIIFLKKQFKNF